MNIFYQSICDNVNFQWLLANQETKPKLINNKHRKPENRYVTDSEDKSGLCVAKSLKYNNSLERS